MINLKNLKSIFVVEDENAKKETDETPKSEQTPVVEKKETPKEQELPPPPVPPQNVNPSNQKTAADKRFVEKLMSVLEANNMEGFDYLEFRSSLKALANLPLDEATRFRSAFATASTMGLSLETLLQSADYYKNILAKEKEHFTAELNTRGAESLRNKSEERVRLEQFIKDKEAQIQALTQQIAQHKQEISQLNQYLDETTTKINEMNTGFTNTYDILVGQMNSDIEKIKNYLKQ